MTEKRDAARRPTTTSGAKQYPLVAQLLAAFVTAVGSTIAIAIFLWVTVLPSFGLLYLLGWLP